MKILIAEDDLTSHTILKTILTKWGHDVISTYNGKDALEKLISNDSPRLALLDWMMPEIDGIQVIKKVRESQKVRRISVEKGLPTYIILLTALAEKEKIVEGLNAGADDYVTKPYDKDELKARIEVGIRIIRLQEELSKKIAELQDALQHIKTLQGIIPICSICHKIRTDADSWQRLEAYIQDHSDAQFSHGICPDCLKKYYGEYMKDEEDKE
ncbi:MAG: response regulator transcription factor [Candidatus Marinimicrobia bacterium]|nr:response regulator transcription factor [Candidatus Neomarinimicrobiota bacterium]